MRYSVFSTTLAICLSLPILAVAANASTEPPLPATREKSIEWIDVDVLCQLNASTEPPLPATREKSIKWIDADVLCQLNAIPSIDRSKFKPTALQAISQQLANSTSITKITASTVKQAIPGLNLPDEPVVVVEGKTKNRYEGFAPGLDVEIVYNSEGVAIQSTVAFPSNPGRRGRPERPKSLTPTK
jgi:hypothetical protein